MTKRFAKYAMAAVLSGVMVLSGTVFASAAEAESDHVKLGVQMYNFKMGGDWDEIDSQEGVEDLLTQIAEAGYEGVEWCNFQLGGEYLDLDATKAKMDELGLETCGMHYHYNADDPEGSAKEVVERCKALNCDKLIFAFSKPNTFGAEADEDGNYTPEQIDEWVENINGVLDVLKTAAEGTDIQVMYHNHADELRTATDGAYVIDKLDCDATEIDVYWTSKGLDGKVSSALDYINKNAEKIQMLHVKDGLDGTLATGEMCGWGKGTFDLQEIVDTAKANPSIEWVIVENDHPENFGMSGMEDAAESAAYAKENIDFAYAE